MEEIGSSSQAGASNTEGTGANTVEEKIAELRKTIPKLHWGRLRFVGSLRVLSVSYVLGLAVALPNLVGTGVTSYLTSPCILWPMASYVGGVSLANLFYHLFCPAIVQKFENLSDFYEHQLGIKKLQMETYPSDPFVANLLHVSEHYIKALGSRAAARVVSLGLYIASFLALLFFAYSLYAITSTN